MGSRSNASRVIIKRKKIVVGGGHHGGAWKVAYADFVTAMMAFFLLMWLLNATTERQRKGIADYFNPNVPINRISGGGDAMFSGESVFANDELARNGVGGLPEIAGLESQRTKARIKHSAHDLVQFEKVKELLIGNGGESLLVENAMKHVITRLTDEGLVIEIFDLKGKPLFSSKDEGPLGELLILVRVIAEAVKHVENDISIEGHLRSDPVVFADSQVWQRSIGRADRVRRLLAAQIDEQARFMRVTGHADRENVQPDPRDVRNNRIEIILLRTDMG